MSNSIETRRSSSMQPQTCRPHFAYEFRAGRYSPQEARAILAQQPEELARWCAVNGIEYTQWPELLYETVPDLSQEQLAWLEEHIQRQWDACW